MNRAGAATLAVVLLTAAHALAIAVYFPDANALRFSTQAFWWIASIAAVAGTLAGVSAFERGDHLRWAWSLLAASVALLLVATAQRSVWMRLAPGAELTDLPYVALRFFVIAGANVLLAWSLILFATTYRRAGLRPQPSAGATAVWIGVSAFAVFLGARQLAIHAERLSGLVGTLATLTHVISTVTDAVVIVLIVPLLRTAFLLRSGRLAWAWWAIGVSSAVWLLYDVRDLLTLAFPNPVLPLEMLGALRTLGLALLGLAGFLQREALREPEPAAATGPHA